MKKTLAIGMGLLCLLVGCSKPVDVTFEAKIMSINEQCMLVETQDEVGFDQASVSIGTADIVGQLEVGQRVSLTIKPNIAESYPVQATAVKVEVLKPTYERLTAEEAKTMMDKGMVDIILDVRTQEEYESGYIEGAILLPDSEIKEQAEVVLQDKDATILIYCRSGRRSESAARELLAMGYNQVYDFGGIVDWPYGTVKE